MSRKLDYAELKQMMEQYFLLLTGKRPMKGDLDMGNHKIVNLSNGLVGKCVFIGRYRVYSPTTKYVILSGQGAFSVIWYADIPFVAGTFSKLMVDMREIAQTCRLVLLKNGVETALDTGVQSNVDIHTVEADVSVVDEDLMCFKWVMTGDAYGAIYWSLVFEVS